MGDDFPQPRRPRVETVAGDGWPEASGCGVQVADQFRRAAQGQIGPGIRGKPVPMSGLPMGVRSDVAVEEGEHFPVALRSQYPGRALESGCLQMAQVLVHGGRPRPHWPQQPVTAAHDPAGHPSARKWHLTRVRAIVIGHRDQYHQERRTTCELKGLEPLTLLAKEMAATSGPAVAHVTGSAGGLLADRDRQRSASPGAAKAGSRPAHGSRDPEREPESNNNHDPLGRVQLVSPAHELTLAGRGSRNVGRALAGPRGRRLAWCVRTVCSRGGWRARAGGRGCGRSGCPSR